MGGGAGLLLGMFGVPALLLWLGHRLRDRSDRQRGAFWGGVVGHSVGVLLALVALQWPPVSWTGGVREWLAFWGMALAGAFGMLVGAARPDRDEA